MTSTAKAGVSHILTVVVEDYFQVGAFSHLIPHRNWERFETNLARDTEGVLALLEATGCRATFFSSGWIADNHPAVLRRIVEHGHEVACQGYVHHGIGELTPDAFAKDVRRSRRAVEDATGQAVLGFRIGRGWIGAEHLWALDVLAEAGFAYDSSVRLPGRADWSAVRRQVTAAGELYEVPPTALPVLGRPLMLSGGNYLRQLPDWLLRPSIEAWIAAGAGPLVFYFHSWELGADQPHIGAASWLQRLRHYRNLDSMPEKVRRYLERYAFTSIAAQLGLEVRRAAERAADALPSTIGAARPAAATGPAKVTLTLVIPCYNEAESLSYLDRTLQRFAERAAVLFHLHYVLVDDGSTDATWNLLQAQFGGRVEFTLLRHQANRGIAAALITGFREVRSEYVAVIDADCTFGPEQLIEMMALMTDEVDVVVASPAHAEGTMHAVPAWRALMSRGAAMLHRGIFRNKLTSYTSCFRLYRRRVLQNVAVYDAGFCGVTEILGRLDLAGCRIAEYPAVLETRLLGQSKIRLFRTIIGHLKLAFRLARLRWLGRPLPVPAAEMQVSYADNDCK